MFWELDVVVIAFSFGHIKREKNENLNTYADAMMELNPSDEAAWHSRLSRDDASCILDMRTNYSQGQTTKICNATHLTLKTVKINATGPMKERGQAWNGGKKYCAL